MWNVHFSNVSEYYPGWEFGHTKQISYFLEYSPDLKLNPVSNWTQVNLPI